MPFINVKTNATVPDEKETAIKSALGQAITAIPGKSESWLIPTLPLNRSKSQKKIYKNGEKQVIIY